MAAPDIAGATGDESDSVETRFGIETLTADARRMTTSMSMPVAGLLNPLTSHPTIGPLAVLVDDVGGIVNSYRAASHEWPVTSELSMELVPGASDLIQAHPDVAVQASAWPVGPKGATALSMCTITHRETEIGCGTVRSFYVPRPAMMPGRRVDSLKRTPTTSLAQLMAVSTESRAAGDTVLRQFSDPFLVNAVGSLHGGVATAGMELVASASVNADSLAAPMRTGSVRVNFLRPFIADETSRYVGTAVRIGRQTALADARALDGDGKVCLTARVTAYR